MQTVSADPFAIFADLRKGDSAPGWLHQAVAAGWGLDPERVAARLIAVSENATFQLEVSGQPYAVLRVHRPGYVDPNQISSELTWIRALAEETGVPVPEVLPLADGSLVLAVDQAQDVDQVNDTAQLSAAQLSGGTQLAGAESCSEEASSDEPSADPWYVVAFAFIHGEVLEESLDPHPYYRRIGEITARFHHHSENWQRPRGFDRFTWNLEDMLGAESRWGDWRQAALTPNQREVMEAAEAEARSAVVPLVKSGGGRGLIHADLRPSNIMASRRGLTVIDFDDCGWSWFLYDFASAFSFIEHEPHTPAIAKDWITGYTSVRPLDDEQIGYACALSMIRRLQMLGWTTTHREDALPAEIWTEQIPGTARIAKNYLTSATWLLD